MAYLETTDLIVKAVLKNCGELQDGTSPYHTDGTVLGYVNDAHMKVIAASNPYGVEVGELWPWAKSSSPGVITLVAPYTTGTVSLTNGNTAGTFSVAPSVGLGSFAGRWLKVIGRPEVFRISAHTAGATAFTLDQAYTDETGATLEFRAVKCDYSIGGGSAKIGRLAGAFRVYRNQSLGTKRTGLILMVDPRNLSEDYPLHEIAEGIPSEFAVVYESDGSQTIRFNKYVAQDTRVDYDWIPVPSDLTDSGSSYPLVPREHRCILEYAASYRLLLDKDDNRADRYLQMTQAELTAMLTGKRKVEHQANPDFGRFICRPGEVKARKGDFQ